MKKYISLLLVACILLTSLFTLSSCFLHIICDYSDEWTSDSTHHWHACLNADCDKISDKAEHTFGTSEVTRKATQEADGINTRTCSVCNYKDNSPIIFTGLSWTEWNEAFSEENFNNFTYHEKAIVQYSGIQVTTTAVYKFTETEVRVSVTAAGSTSTETASGLQAQATKKAMIESIQKMLQYSEFEYDREKKIYNLTGTMKIQNVGNAKSATLRFENGKPKELVYTCTVYSNGNPMDCEATDTFTDFGTTKI